MSKYVIDQTNIRFDINFAVICVTMHIHKPSVTCTGETTARWTDESKIDEMKTAVKNATMYAIMKAEYQIDAAIEALNIEAQDTTE